MPRFYPPAILALLFLTATTASAQTRSEAIDRLMQSYAAERQFNGSVLVAEKGNVIYSHGFGLANMEWNIPNTPTTRFRLASVSKQFTAMVILQLAQEGKLDLDEKVIAYLPEYPKPQGEMITIHHLLTHTSGIPDRTGDTNIEWQLRSSTTPEALLARHWSLPLEFPPGSRFNYSNSGYVALGLIIQKLTAMPYEKAIQQRILDRLGMKSTGFDTTGSIIPQRATGYMRTLTGYTTAPFMDLSQVYSAGSMYSTVEDLHLWDRALYTDALLNDRFRAMMFSPMVISNVGGSYGYGWVINRTAVGPKQDSVTIVAHSGGLIGFGALLTRIIENEQLIVLLDNRNPGAAPLDRITRGIATILHDGQADPPVKSVAAHLYQVIERDGLGAAVARYREIRKQKGREYSLGEGELNTLGYELLKDGRNREAIEIFKLNVEAYPNAFNAYDSLAEAYMIAGEDDLALQNYAHSLVLNASNANAAQMMRKLSK